MTHFGEILITPEKEGKEKHVPHIQAPQQVNAEEAFEMTVVVGKEVPHPNTVEHHIKWIQIFVKEDGPRPAVHAATFDLGPTYASPKITFPLILKKSSTVYALEYCNVHGIWENSLKIEVK